MFIKKKKHNLRFISTENKNKIIKSVKENESWKNMFNKMDDENIWGIIVKWYNEQKGVYSLGFKLSKLINEILNEKK